MVTPGLRDGKQVTHGDRGASFTAPDAVDRLLLDWLNDAQQYHGERTASLISPSASLARGACAPVRSHINRERRWLRLLPERCPDSAEIQTPPIVPALLASENGLILVTGATTWEVHYAGGDGGTSAINMPINTS